MWFGNGLIKQFYIGRSNRLIWQWCDLAVFVGRGNHVNWQWCDLTVLCGKGQPCDLAMEWFSSFIWEGATTWFGSFILEQVNCIPQYVLFHLWGLYVTGQERMAVCDRHVEEAGQTSCSCFYVLQEENRWERPQSG